MCTVLLPPGDNPIAVNKYIMPYYIICVTNTVLLLFHYYCYYYYHYYSYPLLLYSILGSSGDISSSSGVLYLNEHKLYASKIAGPSGRAV